MVRKGELAVVYARLILESNRAETRVIEYRGAKDYSSLSQFLSF